MIRWLVNLGKWLEARFPEKREVSLAEYVALIQRIEAIEAAAVHKGAVQDLVRVVSNLKIELGSFKASLGFTPTAEQAKIEAYLNGEPVGTPSQENQ